MKGLEVSEVRFSELNNEHRIDAEYFSKENLAGIKRLSDFGTFQIGDIAEVTDGIHTSIDYDENSRVNLISATSPKENVFDLSRGAFISEKAHAENPRTALRKNDVIISTVGTIGNCAVVDDSILPANSDRHVGIIRIKDDYSPYILSTFLLSKYGRMQTLRESTGNVQLNLFIYKLRELQIPDFSTDFQSQIESLVKSAHEKLSESKSLYAQAEDTLLSELGLKNWQPKNENINVKTFSESFLSSGRLDAEYYQSKYDEIEREIKKYHGGYFIFGETIEYIFTGEYSEEYMNKSADLVFYIRSLNMKSGRIEQDDYHFVNPAKFTKKVRTGNIITARVGTIGVFAEVDDSLDYAICSDNIICFKLPNGYNPSVYTLLLNSKPIFELVDRLARGSVQQRLNQETIKDLVLPKLPKSIQDEISSKIQQSFALKAESKRLLEEAKLMVEQEIEKGSK